MIIALLVVVLVWLTLLAGLAFAATVYAISVRLRELPADLRPLPPVWDQTSIDRTLAEIASL